YSEPWGQRLGRYLIDLVVFLGRSVLHAIPDFFTVLVILLLTHGLTRLVGQLIESVSSGRFPTSWLDAGTTQAPRRIVIFVIWLFALTAAFPFIPGSDSAAFRGIGVLAGVMLSFGSVGIVNQAMSGLVVIYSRAFHEGDYVKIGEVEGIVTRLGTL